MKDKKTIIQRIWFGVKVGWNTPMIPPKVSIFHNHPLTRISRVVGSICVVMYLSNKYLLLMFPLNYIALVFALLHFIYIVIISIIKLVYGIKVWRDKKLEIRNYSIDRLATAAGKILYCWKYGCQVGLGLVGTLFLIDSMLEAGNQEKVFTPLIGKGVNYFFKGKLVNELFLKIQNDTQDLLESGKKSLINALENAENILDRNSELNTKGEIRELKSAIKKVNNEENMAAELAEKIKKWEEDEEEK